MGDNAKSMCNPALCDPEKYDRIWKGVCEKEMAHWGGLALLGPKSSSLPEVPPTPGEPVLISGILRRPELNGLRGKIVDESEDAYGRVIVRLCPQGGPPRRMRITRARLQPVQSTSALLSADAVGSHYDSGFPAAPGTAGSRRSGKSVKSIKSISSQLPISISSTGTLHLQTKRMKPAQSMPALLTRSPVDGLPGYTENEDAPQGYVSPGCRKGYFRKDNGGYYTKIN